VTFDLYGSQGAGNGGKGGEATVTQAVTPGDLYQINVGGQGGWNGGGSGGSSSGGAGGSNGGGATDSGSAVRRPPTACSWPVAAAGAPAWPAARAAGRPARRVGGHGLGFHH